MTSLIIPNEEDIMFWLASTPLALTGEQRVTWYLVWACMLWVVVAAVAVASRRQLLRQPLAVRVA